MDVKLKDTRYIPAERRSASSLATVPHSFEYQLCRSISKCSNLALLFYCCIPTPGHSIFLYRSTYVPALRLQCMPVIKDVGSGSHASATSTNQCSSNKVRVRMLDCATATMDKLANPIRWFNQSRYVVHQIQMMDHLMQRCGDCLTEEHCGGNRLQGSILPDSINQVYTGNKVSPLLVQRLLLQLRVKEPVTSDKHADYCFDA